MIRSRKTTITTRYRASFDAKELREKLNLTEGSKIYVQVPGGGDWSNQELELDSDCPLIAEYTTTQEGIENKSPVRKSK